MWTKNSLWRLELRVELVDEILVGRGEDPVDDIADQILQTIQKVGERDERALGLEVGVLGLKK